MPNLPSRLGPILTGLRNAALVPAPSLRLMGRSQDRWSEDERIPPLLPRLVIPMKDSTEDTVAYNRYFEQGQFLSRQENWAELGKLIRRFDAQRIATPGGTPVSEVLAAGARFDAVQAAIEAVTCFDEAGARLPLNALQEVLEDHSEDHGVALVVARAHIDIGWAWRGDNWGSPLPTVAKGAFHAHFRAAARIIDRFDPFELDAPAMAGARCALLAVDASPEMRVADDFEDLIDLDPGNANRMRAFGLNLLPRWFGSYKQLELQARRIAARTADLWGAGAYTWVYLDALSVDPGAFDKLDAEYFAEGLHDILERRPDQHTVNMLAAFTGYTLSGMACDPGNRGRIASCFNWIVQDHLREVHPLVWMRPVSNVSHPQPQPADRDLQKRGRVRALSSLAEHFAPQIRAGNRVLFENGGITIAPSA